MRLTGRLGALDGSLDNATNRPAMHVMHSPSASAGQAGGPLRRAQGGEAAGEQSAHGGRGGGPGGGTSTVCANYTPRPRVGGSFVYDPAHLGGGGLKGGVRTLMDFCKGLTHLSWGV